jgi:hypothetical protein
MYILDVSYYVVIFSTYCVYAVDKCFFCMLYHVFYLNLYVMLDGCIVSDCAPHPWSGSMVN